MRHLANECTVHYLHLYILDIYYSYTKDISFKQISHQQLKNVNFIAKIKKKTFNLSHIFTFVLLSNVNFANVHCNFLKKIRKS